MLRAMVSDVPVAPGGALPDQEVRIACFLLSSPHNERSLALIILVVFRGGVATAGFC